MNQLVLNNQSILDVSLQHTGTVENCFAIAIANGFSVSDLLTAGTSLLIPENLRNDNDVLNYYSAKKIQPATAITEDTEIPTLKGIGYMNLGGNFKVS
jgi:hypothetical protein